MTGGSAALAGFTLAPGAAEGQALVLGAPLSFWGGVAPDGTISDVHHPQRGASVTGRMLVLPGGRGSSSSSSVLAELIRTGCAPAAIIMAEPDEILVLGSVVAAELYGTRVPVVHAGPGAIVTGDRVRIEAGQSGGIARITVLDNTASKAGHGH